MRMILRSADLHCHKAPWAFTLTCRSAQKKAKYYPNPRNPHIPSPVLPPSRPLTHSLSRSLYLSSCLSLSFFLYLSLSLLISLSARALSLPLPLRQHSISPSLCSRAPCLSLSPLPLSRFLLSLSLYMHSLLSPSLSSLRALSICLYPSLLFLCEL